MNDFMTDMGILDADSILENIKHDNMATNDDAISKICKVTEALSMKCSNRCQDRGSSNETSKANMRVWMGRGGGGGGGGGGGVWYSLFIKNLAHYSFH